MKGAAKVTVTFDDSLFGSKKVDSKSEDFDDLFSEPPVKRNPLPSTTAKQKTPPTILVSTTMATPHNVTEQALRELEDQLTCDICLDSYTEPKLLQCFHVFCKQCLEQLVVHDRQGLSLHCPSCRQTTLLPPTGVSGLRTAFYLNNLFEVYDAIKKVKKPQKTQCEKCKKRVATNFCRNCGQCICARCTETHQEWEEFSSHEVITITQLEGDVAQLLPAKKKVLFCSKHPTNELDIYCETCEELICRDCIVRIH